MSFSRTLAAKLGVSILTGFIILVLISGIIGIFCWPYGINSWLVFAGKPPSIVWWQGFLIGCIPVFGKFSVIFAVITWILMMFLT